MSKPKSEHKPRGTEISIDATQLRPGVHVRLPLSWMEHEFLFNSFVIADEDQAKRIAAMNLPSLFSDVKLSKVPPLPKQDVASTELQTSEAEKSRFATLKAELMAEKLERANVMAKMRKRMLKAQINYTESAHSVVTAFKSLLSAPKESIRQISDISERSASELLNNPDCAMALITEKTHNDGHSAHALSVMTLALMLAKRAELPEVALRTIGIGALLHDIGKFSFHASMLNCAKRNKFEEEVYRTHCRIGYENALKCGCLSPAMMDVILHHHERINGTGFPDQLVGEDISFAARVVAIADRFDNLTNPVDFHLALSPSEALSMMWHKEKDIFDNTLLQLFVRAMGVYPPGSLVQLSDERIGVVIASATMKAPLSPQVLVYDPGVPRSQAIIIDLLVDTATKIVRPLRLSERSEHELNYLLPHRRINWFYIQDPLQ